VQEWRAELKGAMERVQRMRALLRSALEAKGTPGTWKHITDQIGMFSYTGRCIARRRWASRAFHACLHAGEPWMRRHAQG